MGASEGQDPLWGGQAGVMEQTDAQVALAHLLAHGQLQRRARSPPWLTSLAAGTLKALRLGDQVSAGPSEP